MNESVSPIDVEEWYHILDSGMTPPIDKWPELESRLECPLDEILEVLERHSVKSTMFWLGWAADKYPALVRRCVKAGHEIASHGYGHVFAYQVGHKGFYEDILRGKKVLEDIVGEKVIGFRAPGFGIKDGMSWAFEVIKEVGYEYDSSVFPGHRGHGGMLKSHLEPYLIRTAYGPLPELGISMVEFMGRRFCLFGGGYLRLSPKWIIHMGIKYLHSNGRPLIVYVHPREVDPEHPRLPLSLFRRFKSYVNLKSTLPKLEWLCSTFKFITMRELAEQVK